MRKRVFLILIILVVLGGLLLFVAQTGSQRLIKFVSIAAIAIVAAATVTYWASRKILGPRGADELFVNLTISFVAFIVFLLVSEAALRLIYRDLTTTNDFSSFFSQRWRTTVRINSYGFREREFSLDKPEGTFRIAVIGDSLTFGQGVDEDYRFTNLLDQRLNSDRNGAYEVLNFGIRGAETIDHLEILQAPVLGTDPDFVLLQWYINDVEGWDKSGRPKRPRTLIPAELRWRSALFSMLHDLWINTPQRLGLGKSYSEYMEARFGDPDSISSREANDALRDFLRTASENILTVGIVIFNHYTKGDSSLDFLVDRVLEICRQEGITCADLRSTFAPFKDNVRQLWVNSKDAHPGQLAHQLVADRLIEAFWEMWASR